MATPTGSGAPANGTDAEQLRDHSVGELVSQLSTQMSELARKEVDLAKAELTEKGKQAGLGAGMFGGAGVAGLLALGALTACLTLVLTTFLAPWLAALIVTLAWGAVAAVLALQGRERVREATPAAPEQTIESVKEDIQWAKNPTRSAQR
jgi:uncharacterized membrane protein YqjE